jgi:hypothetical protein
VVVRVDCVCCDGEGEASKKRREGQELERREETMRKYGPYSNLINLLLLTANLTTTIDYSDGNH